MASRGWKLRPPSAHATSRPTIRSDLTSKLHGPSPATRGQPRPYPAIRGWLQPFLATRGWPQPSPAIRGPLRPSPAQACWCASFPWRLPGPSFKVNSMMVAEANLDCTLLFRVNSAMAARPTWTLRLLVHGELGGGGRGQLGLRPVVQGELGGGRGQLGLCLCSH